MKTNKLIRAPGLVVHEVAPIALDVEGHQRSPHRRGCGQLDPARLILVPEGGHKPDEVVVRNRLPWNSLPQIRILAEHATAGAAHRTTAAGPEPCWQPRQAAVEDACRGAHRAGGCPRRGA